MNDSKPQHLPFDDGLPTRPDVDLLLATWPEPKVGDLYEYAAVEKLIGVASTSNRFRSVTSAWRKRLHERGFVVECKPSQAFFVATAEQISAATYGTLKSIGRKARKHRSKLAIAKVDSDEMRQAVEHQGRLMLAVEKEAKRQRMNVLPNTAVLALPKARSA